MNDPAREAVRQRMEFLRRIVGKEVEHLADTTERLFSETETLTELTVGQS